MKIHGKSVSGWVVFGTILTIAYITWIWWFVLVPIEPDASCDIGDVAFHQTCLSFNEVGDLAAGAFAPLAFLWLIIAVVIQAQELSAQREELQLTRKEMVEQRGVWESQLEETRAQTNALLAEASERERAQADQELDTLLEALVRILRSNFNSINIDATGRAKFSINLLQSCDIHKGSPEQAIQNLTAEAKTRKQFLSEKAVTETTPISPESFDQIMEIFDIILTIKPRLSQTASLKLRTLRLSELEEFLSFPKASRLS